MLQCLESLTEPTYDSSTAAERVLNTKFIKKCQYLILLALHFKNKEYEVEFFISPGPLQKAKYSINVEQLHSLVDGCETFWFQTQWQFLARIY